MASVFGAPERSRISDPRVFEARCSPSAELRAHRRRGNNEWWGDPGRKYRGRGHLWWPEKRPLQALFSVLRTVSAATKPIVAVMIAPMMPPPSDRPIVGSINSVTRAEHIDDGIADEAEAAAPDNEMGHRARD